MIRTAEQILKERFPNAASQDWFKPMVECINEGRKEIVKECAERVETVNTSKNPWEPYYEVDKQSIFKLIDQIK